MRIIQRIRPGVTGEKLDAIIKIHEKLPESFNEVWLSTLYGFPTLERHKEEALLLAKEAEKLRKAGIRVSMQLANSVGHGLYISPLDCSGLVYDGSPAEKLVGHDGSVADYAFCWWGEHIKDYIDRQVRLYVSAIRPAEFWIDDDLRALGHAPVDFGCFCDSCIRRFNKKYGDSFDREGLVEDFLHGDGRTRRNFIAFQREGIASLTELICRAVKESNGDTVVALQNGSRGAYSGYGHDYIFDAILRATGKAPLYRPGAGAYDDHDPNAIAEKIYELDCQRSMLPAYVQRTCPEIESTPHNAMGKSMAGTALETAMNFANGATDISYAMLGTMTEPPAFYEKGFALFASQAEYCKKLASLAEITHADGISFAVSKERHLRPLAKTDSIYDFACVPDKFDLALARCGLPLTYGETDLTLLAPEQVALFSDGEIQALLCKNVLTDGETIEILQKRGFDLGIRIGTPKDLDTLYLTEVPTEHPLNRAYPESFSASFFSPGKGNHRYLLSLPENSEILSVYAPTDKLTPVTNDASLPFGYASAIVPTAVGGKWAVLGYGLWKTTVPSSRRDRILSIADALSPLPARLLSPVQAYLFCRADSEGSVRAVSVTNATVGAETELKLLIRRPYGTRFFFDSQYNGKTLLSAEKTADGYIVTIPALAPWSVGTVFAEKDFSDEEIKIRRLLTVGAKEIGAKLAAQGKKKQ